MSQVNSVQPRLPGSGDYVLMVIKEFTSSTWWAFSIRPCYLVLQRGGKAGGLSGKAPRVLLTHQWSALVLSPPPSAPAPSSMPPAPRPQLHALGSSPSSTPSAPRPQLHAPSSSPSSVSWRPLPGCPFPFCGLGQREDPRRWGSLTLPLLPALSVK